MFEFLIDLINKELEQINIYSSDNKVLGFRKTSTILFPFDKVYLIPFFTLLQTFHKFEQFYLLFYY